MRARRTLPPPARPESPVRLAPAEPRGTTRAVFTLLLLTLPLTGCLRDPDPFDLDTRALTVHSILVTGADTALVVVTRPDPAGGFIELVDPVDDAVVALVRGADTTWLGHDPGRVCIGLFGRDEAIPGGCYRGTLPGPIVAGETYRLLIRLPDGSEATGQTIPPPPLLVRAPEPGLRVELDCRSAESCYGAYGPGLQASLAEVPAAWSGDVAIGGVQIHAVPRTIWYRGAAYPGEACTVFGGFRNAVQAPSDSIPWMPAQVACGTWGDPAFEPLFPALFDSLRIDLTFHGWSRDLARYMAALGSGIRLRDATRGLDGAVGVFAAQSAVFRELVLIRTPPPDAVPSSLAEPAVAASQR